MKSRIFQLVIGLCTLAPAFNFAAQPASTSTDRMDRDLIEVTIPQLHRYYDQHRYTVSQVVDWYLARIARYNGVYKPVEQVFDADARAAAKREDSEAGATHGPLWGVPIVIKANTSIEGKVTTNGWEGFVVPGHELIAPRDATIVARLRAAGAIILGHTNMPDFANSDTTRSSSFGRTGNAYDVRFSPGGSSGGTVTSVTGNMAMLGNGTDTGNSIRMPAGTSALIGVFPTRGLVSIAGIAPLDWLLDDTGPDRPQRHRCGDRARCHGGRGPARSGHPGHGRESAARAVHAIPQERRAQGQALRGAGVHSRRHRHPVPRHTGRGLGHGG